MADIAGIWDLQLLCLRWRDEAESVTADVHIGNRLLDLRHVTGDTFISAARDLVMSVLFNGSSVRTIRRMGTVAFQADYIRRPYEIGAVSRSVNVMATETPDTVCVHRAGYEIISLHAILVGCSIGEVGECGFAKAVILQLPEALQVEADVKPNGPVVVPALDRIL